MIRLNEDDFRGENDEDAVTNGPLVLVTSRKSEKIDIGHAPSMVVFDDEHGSQQTSDDKDEESNSIKPEDDPRIPPDGGYGWVCAFCAFLSAFAAWGGNASYGIFLNHYLNTSKFKNATSLDFAFIAGISTGIALIITPLITVIQIKIGMHATILIGTVVQSAGFICASFAKEIWQLYLSQGLAVSIGMGFIYVPPTIILPQWFKKNRSLANGISACGSGVGGLVYNLSCQAIINKTGDTPWALRFIGITNIVLLLICTVFIRSRNKIINNHNEKLRIKNNEPKKKLKLFDPSVLKLFPVLMICIWVALVIIGFCVFQFSLASYATSVGLSASKGSVILSLLSTGQIVGRPSIGFISDKIGRLNVTVTLSGIIGLLCFIFWMPATTFNSLAAYAFINGLMIGVIWVNYPPLIADSVPLELLSSAFAVATVFAGVPALFGEVIAMKIRRTQYSGGKQYRYVQVVVGLVYIVGIIPLLFLRFWKVKRLLTKHIALLNEKKQHLINGNGSVNEKEKLALESLFLINKKKYPKSQLQDSEQRITTLNLGVNDIMISNIDGELDYINRTYLNNTLLSKIRIVFFVCGKI